LSLVTGLIAASWATKVCTRHTGSWTAAAGGFGRVDLSAMKPPIPNARSSAGKNHFFMFITNQDKESAGNGGRLSGPYEPKQSAGFNGEQDSRYPQ